MYRTTNATIRINTERLDIPLKPLYPRQLHSFRVRIEGIPALFTSPVMRVFKTDGQSHFDIPVEIGASGAFCYVVGTCFPDSGAARYELHAYDEFGNPAPLGCGDIEVFPFSQSSSPLVPGQPVPIMQIADATGALHTIQAVPDGMGGYTTIIDADTEGGTEE